MKILLEAHYRECNFDISGNVPSNEQLTQTFGRKIFFIEDKEKNERLILISDVSKRRLFGSNKNTNLTFKLLYFNEEMEKKFDNYVLDKFAIKDVDADLD